MDLEFIKHIKGRQLTQDLLFEVYNDYGLLNAPYKNHTEKAQLSDMRVYLTWCASREVVAVPADFKDIAYFLEEMAIEKSLATVMRYVFTINMVHKMASFDELPSRNIHVIEAIRKIKEAKGEGQKQAEPLRFEQIKKVIGSKELTETQEIRDAMILMVAYRTMARRSELVNLKVADIEIMEGYGVAYIKGKGKHKQEGRYLCEYTVKLIQKWLARVDGREGDYLIRGINRWGGVSAGNKKIGDLAIVTALQRITGLKVTGHSTRVGSTHDMVEADMTVTEMMEAGGWNDPAMPKRYARNLKVKNGGMAKLTEMQKM